MDDTELRDKINQVLSSFEQKEVFLLWFVLQAYKIRALDVRHGWSNGAEGVLDILQAIADIKPKGLLPRGLNGGYIHGHHTTINHNDLVELVRELKVISILK